MLYNFNTRFTTIALQLQKIQRLEVENNTLSINFECAPPERYVRKAQTRQAGSGFRPSSPGLSFPCSRVVFVVHFSAHLFRTRHVEC